MQQLAQGTLGEHLAVAGSPAYPSYIVKGSEKNLMVEAGLNLMGPCILRDVEKILGGRERLSYLFLTHSHYDHLGAADYLLRRVHGLVAGAHERVGQLMCRESVLAVMNSLSEVQLPLFPEVSDYREVAMGPLEIALTLAEGDETDLGGLTVRVHEVPGHTKDSLAFFLPELGMLFPGEAAGVPQGPEGSEPQVCFLTSYDDYLASLERIVSLAPRILCIGHGWIFTEDDASRFLDSSLAATPAYRALIERYLDQEHGDVEKTIETMLRKEYDEKGTIYQERTAYLTNLKAQVKHIASLNG